MLLSKRTVMNIDDVQANIIGHLCFAAQKLWNVGNYEKRNYHQLGFDKYPNWYEQKKQLKANMWYKSLPSQTAQETLKVLEQSWKSFFKLQQTGGIVNPQPPRFKHDKISITYMQNGIQHQSASPTIRFTLPKQLKTHMSEKYNIHANYLYLENKIFSSMDTIKQIQIYPPVDGKLTMIVVYEVDEVGALPDNGKYLSIDLGVCNLMTCYNNVDNRTEILGKRYMEISHYYDKQIAHYQSINALQQTAKGVKYPKLSKRVKQLYEDKRNAIYDLLHKTTRYIVNECVAKDIHTVILGDITHIRDNKNLGHQNNQTFHAMPYAKIAMLLEYKLALCGIRLIKVKECYSSQCSPFTPAVCEEYANKSNRKHRGLYIDLPNIWNADAVGAYNIMRIYSQETQKCIEQSVQYLSCPVKVSA